METREAKKHLREELLERRARITPAQRCLWDSAVGLALLRLPEYRAADTILVYLSTPGEVSTAIPVAHAIGMDKRVGVPRWSGGRMVFCLLTDHRELVPGYKGILQPPAEAAPMGDFTGSTLCVVPGLAADRQGRRVGYGGGYYDRFLADFPGCTVLTAYDGMVYDTLPAEPHDLPVNIILTPGGVLRINKEDVL